MKRGNWVWGGLVILAIGGVSLAQVDTGFEAPGYSGSAAGVDLNGQNSWYNPLPANSISHKVYTYAGNALGVVANPTGGDQFAGGTGPAGTTPFCRSQLDMPYGAGEWDLSFDVAVLFLGAGAAAQNIGSAAPADAVANRSAIQLSTWTAPATPTTWDADMVWYNAAGGQLIEKVPNVAFQGLPVNKWYRRSMKVDFDTNKVLEVSLTDIVGGTTATYAPAAGSERYLTGGSASTLPLPVAFRLFAGTTTPAGNTMCFDNVKIAKAAGGTCKGDEAVTKAKCKTGGNVTVYGTGGNDKEKVVASTSTGQTGTGKVKKGKVKIKIAGVPLGKGTATMTWDCGATGTADYKCK